MSRSNAGKKRGAQPRQSPGGGGGKRWPYFVGGLLLGLLLAGGIYLLQILPTAMELRDRGIAAGGNCKDDGKAKEPAATALPAGEKPVKFDFYTMLPKQEVVAPVAGRKTTTAVPVPTPSAPAPAIAPAPPVAAAPAQPAATAPLPPPAAARPAAPAAEKSAGFALQAGSFATRAEADRRRGELVLSGLSVNVAQAKTAAGETRFRVMVGPFASEAAMKKAQQQLAGMKVDTLPVRSK